MGPNAKKVEFGEIPLNLFHCDAGDRMVTQFVLTFAQL